MSQADLVVVGGGIIGASIAWRLAQAGLSVAVLDSGRLGGEASWAGAGMLAPGGEIRERTPWTDFALESLRRYPSFIEELERESGCPVEFRALGALEVAWNEAEVREQLERREIQQALGISSVPLNADEIRKNAPLVSEKVAGGLFFPRDALVDPREVMRALNVCLARLGVQVKENTPARALEVTRGGVRIASAGGEWSAAGAVLAAGAWSSGIPVTVNGAPRELPAGFPVRGHLLGYSLPPGSLPAILRHGHTYIAQRSSGFTIAGSSEEQVGFDRTPNFSLVDELHARACELVPALAASRQPQVWLGFRPGIAGGTPSLDALPGAPVWTAYGHYRNGILLAPATADRVAGAITASWGKGSPMPSGSR